MAYIEAPESSAYLGQVTGHQGRISTSANEPFGAGPGLLVQAGLPVQSRSTGENDRNVARFGGPRRVWGTASPSQKWLSLIHISEPTRQAEISYAVFCLKK